MSYLGIDGKAGQGPAYLLAGLVILAVSANKPEILHSIAKTLKKLNGFSRNLVSWGHA